VPIGANFSQVLEAAALGAEWAWQVLWVEYAGPLLGYLRARGAIEPDDALSEVFLDLARRIGSFEGTETQFRSWVFTIAHSRMVDQRRKSKRKPGEQLDGFDTMEPGSDPADRFEVSETEREALALLSALSEDQRQVIALRVIADLSLEQVATIMGRNVNAVKQLQHRALRALRTNQGVTKTPDETVTATK
jgi:RNA polymerase sigma-70 factor (ECF subfamily)